MESLSDRVIDIIALNRGKSANEINENTDLFSDLALDSLDKVELIMEFESTFGVTIADDDAEKIRTVADIVRFLEKHSK